jgi:branched-chain amino acid transport system ATP-binding protein
MLSIEGLVTGYERLEVLHGLDLSVEAKQAVTVVGANGAGKSTLCRALSGLIKVRGGSIRFDGQDITHASTSARVRAGVIQVPEGRQVFPQMTVLENLTLGAFVHGKPVASDLDPIFALFPILQERRDKHAGMLSGGEQQLLALARALMSRPRMLILDEPSQGLSPKAVELVADAVAEIRRRGVAILLVEQNLALATAVAQMAYVLENGQSVKHGPAEEILSGSLVADSYLGH